MKPIAKLAALCLCILPFAFTACLKDNCAQMHTYSYFIPVYKTKDEVRANIKSNPSKSITQPGKLYVYGNYIFLNELDKGIHVIDNSNPSAPHNISFIDIPGNLDIAVKGNTLYADLYTDLVTLDITNPSNVVVKKITDNVFPYRYYGGGFIANSSNGIITDWIKKDTTVKEDCNRVGIFTMSSDVFNGGFLGSAGTSSPNANTPIGQGGSMARFALMNDRLYTVTSSDLDVFNITSPNNPVRTNTVNIGWDIETIYPFRNRLFIGSMTGMYIYNVSNPDVPARVGQFSHVRTCDPVIADDTYAYITLRSGTPCQGFTNELDIVRLNDLTNPTLVKVYNMKNPHGLSKDGNRLFICDGIEGLKIYDASDVNNLQMVKRIEGIETYDVIAFNNRALVVAKDGLYQYDYSDMNNITLLSKIVVNN